MASAQQHLAEGDQQQHGLHHQFSSSAMMQPSSSSSSPSLHPDLIGAKESGGGAYGLGELDEALYLYLNGQQQLGYQKQHHSIDLQQQNTRTSSSYDGGLRPPTLNIFPSRPMHVDPSSAINQLVQVNKSNENDPRGLVAISEAAQGETSRDSSSRMLSPESMSMDILGSSALQERTASFKKDPTSGFQQVETRRQPRDAKMLRRLAQNREAARKSRIRKKAYVQQLESSRVKLAQLEQEILRARSKGMYMGGGIMVGPDQQGLPGAMNNFTSDAAIFDMEYGRWLEEHHRLLYELRTAVEEQLAENELQLYVDNCLIHFDEILNLKTVVAKADIFHLVSGSWKSPAERCFMWIGGFRPSQIIKIVMNKIEGLSEQQAVEICGLQRSMEEAEEALSQGLEVLNQSLSDTIVYDSLASPPRDMANYMGQMTVAASKLSALEGFVRQADNLRRQTIHRVHQIFMPRQMARCLLLIAEYFHRLRSLSSLWLSRPRQE